MVSVAAPRETCWISKSENMNGSVDKKKSLADDMLELQTFLFFFFYEHGLQN
jgi:hypothetical protein